MTKLESLGAVHTHTHTHTQYSYQKECWTKCTQLANKFFGRRILLGVAGIKIYIDSECKTRIDCIIVNGYKRNIYNNMVYPFCV